MRTEMANANLPARWRCSFVILRCTTSTGHVWPQSTHDEPRHHQPSQPLRSAQHERRVRKEVGGSQIEPAQRHRRAPLQAAAPVPPEAKFDRGRREARRGHAAISGWMPGNPGTSLLNIAFSRLLFRPPQAAMLTMLALARKTGTVSRFVGALGVGWPSTFL